MKISTQPLLTIAIPTYNRAASLKQSLGAIVRQIEAIPEGWDQIELLVSDNCSNDETPSIVDIVGHPSLKYVRNSENIGMEGNFLSVFKLARGRYVWTFSDDDLLLDGVIEKVLDHLLNYECDLIFIKPNYLFAELDTFTQKKLHFCFHHVTAEEFALRANGVLSFLSAVIVNKKKYFDISSNPDIRRYAGTWLAHYEWIYTLLGCGRNFYIVDKAVICARSGATGGYDLFKVFGEHYLTIGADKLAHNPRMQEDLKNAMLYWHFPGFIFHTRRKNFGKFEYKPDEIFDNIVSWYGNTWFVKNIIFNLLFGSEFLLRFSYRYSQIYARVWMMFRRLLLKMGSKSR